MPANHRRRRAIAMLLRLAVPILLGAELPLAPSPALAQRCAGVAEAPTPSGTPVVVPVVARRGDRQSRSGAGPEAEAGALPLVTAKGAAGSVALTFVGHATFLIESPRGVTIETDYNDYIRADVVPDIATMNIAHDTHFSRSPDPRIKHVLRGWNPDGGPVEHDLTVADVHVLNIPTNIRDYSSGGTLEYGNSIFVFEIAGLCIAHLGHLHHTLTAQQLGQLGQMDVLLFPVDGGYTIDLDGMVDVLRTVKAPLMIPMHMFSEYGLERFLRRVRAEFEVVRSPTPTIAISRETLPGKQQVLVLPGH